MRYTFPLYAGTTTRQVNEIIQAAITQALTEMAEFVNAEPDREVRRTKSRGRHYVHGFRSATRTTLVASYDVGSNEVYVAFPTNYSGWGQADWWMRVRVRAHDLILSSAIVDAHGKAAA